MTQPIDFYFWPTPNGWKISIALEEFALPYTTHLVNIGAGDQHKPEFLKISPNNKMPAIVDPDGPDATPISIFESGAILLYLAEKHGRFDGATPREKIAVREWLMWQMGGLGPMAGQTHHFVKFASEDIPYAKKRYVDETARLYKVLNDRLADNRFVAGATYTIADMAIWGWASLWEGQLQTLDDKPHMARWLDEVFARPAVQRGRALHMDLRKGPPDRYAAQLMA